MILAIDIGNSNIMLGGFEGDDLTFVVGMSTEINKTADEYASKILGVLAIHNAVGKAVTGAIISSVVPPLNAAIKKAVRLLWGIDALTVGPGIVRILSIAKNRKIIK